MVLFNKQRYEFFSKSQFGDYAAFETGKKYVYSMRLTGEGIPACVLPPFMWQVVRLYEQKCPPLKDDGPT